jgi:hypothetical protein
MLSVGAGGDRLLCIIENNYVVMTGGLGGADMMLITEQKSA